MPGGSPTDPIASCRPTPCSSRTTGSRQVRELWLGRTPLNLHGVLPRSAAITQHWRRNRRKPHPEEGLPARAAPCASHANPRFL